MWLVFEAAACNLEQYLKKAGKVSLATLQLWVSSILRGLAFLHSSPLRVQHLDLKPANILLFCDGTVAKLCDFEFASAAPCPSSDVPFPLSPRGSPLYTAPEIIAGVCDPNGKSDMFSFGVLVSELVTGYLTGATTGTRFVLDESTRFDVAESAVLILGGFWPAMAPILSRCVSVDPMDRPTATTALACLFPVDPPAVSTSEEDV